jgi:hypothetical protein
VKQETAYIELIIIIIIKIKIIIIIIVEYSWTLSRLETDRVPILE